MYWYLSPAGTSVRSDHRITARGWRLVDAPAATDAAQGHDVAVYGLLTSMRVSDLRALARDAGLPVSGTKAELVERLSGEGL